VLRQLRESGAPSIRRPLPAQEGRIAVVAVSSEITIEPRSGSSAFFVVSGRGRTLGAVDQALAANHLALVLAQTPLRIEARPGAPLLLIDYHGSRKFYRVPQFVELSSASRPGAVDPRLTPPGGRADVDELDVPTITLNDLLRQQGVERIDLLSMDIEGHEPEALAGFDIRRYRPRLVCIEAQVVVADRIYAYLRGHGYARIDRYLPFDPRNWYFAPQAGGPSGAP
jgi:hypothetical protein